MDIVRIVIRCVIAWMVIGLLFNITVEGLPSAKKPLTWVQKQMLWFDIMMGPIGWLFFGAIGLSKLFKKKK